MCLVLFLVTSCKKRSEISPDHPRLTPNVVVRDVTFRSFALNRDMQYRAVLPSSVRPERKWPVVYLLHGGGADFHSWTNDSDVAQFAEKGFVFVMPEGNSSYYINAAGRPQDKYEDYIVNDLITDAESRFPIAANRNQRAVIGVSMGGFGAINLSLRHPDLFVFVGALSPAIDVPSRPFSIKRIGQWREHSSIFGPWGSETRRANDPYLLVASVDSAVTPYFYVSCGEQEGLLPANRKLARLFADRRFRFEFHVGPGGHNWNQWNARLPDVFRSLSEHIQQTR